MTIDLDQLKFDDAGLVAAIVQDAGTGSVLMLAWMDREAIPASERTGQVHFHSRSRAKLWRKGEESGNTLHLVEMTADCDGDALLVRAHPKGPVCHTGAQTCWGPDPAPALARAISELAAVVGERKRELPAGSYSAELFRKGTGAIAQKLGEEALETALAAVSEPRERALSELTDLLYSLILLATQLGISGEDVVRSLAEKKIVATSRPPGTVA